MLSHGAANAAACPRPRGTQRSVEIVLADAGNRLGSGGTLQGSRHVVVVVMGFMSPLESRTTLLQWRFLDPSSGHILVLPTGPRDPAHSLGVCGELGEG